LAPLSELRRLQIINLFGCRPPVPPELVQGFTAHPCLTKLIADEAVGVPREVLSRTYSDNCLPRLRTYLDELDLGAEAENEVKVILLGNGRVGKTQLCRRFRGESFDDAVPSTHGVQLWREELRLSAKGEEEIFQVNWWDFGGQDIYHGTHALFLRSRAVFLILWTPEFENRNELEENGIPLRNQPLAYWLDYVRSLAGEGSPVIVVQSRCDRFADRRSDPPIPKGLGFVQCCFYSAKEDTGRATLEGQIHNAIGYLLERNGALEIGRGRAEVRRRLYAWRTADQQREPAERQHRTLTLDQFRALCDEVGDIVSWEHALDYFHQTGVLFYDRDLFANCIILDQDWALDAIYTVFHRAQVAPFLRDSGRFTREDLAFLAWREHSGEEQKLFLGLMESCGVCFPSGKTAKGEARYVAPDLLPPFEAVAGRVHLTWKQVETSNLRLEYRFFHPAIIRGLMREIGRQARDLAEYWKYGLWLKDGKRDAQLLVHFLDTRTAEAPGAGALELKAQGGDAIGLLRTIHQAVRRQRIGEEPEERLTLNGTTVAQNALSTRTDDGRARATDGTWVAAEPFAAFFEDREHQPEKSPAREKPLDVTVRRRGPEEKPREVFISYAWGDDKTRKGKIREQVAKELYAALKKEDRFLPVWDRGQIKNGELISAFIRRLTRADLVVAVISDKYLRSPYCMHEIYKLWQRCQAEPDEMVKRLVPIVLPGVKIGNLPERAPYVRYWRDKAHELAELHNELHSLLDPQTVQDIRLVREFSEHVDGILRFLNDVLMPRQLKVHLDQGFPAVLDAVRRQAGLS
jgi:internalin A